MTVFWDISPLSLAESDKRITFIGMVKIGPHSQIILTLNIEKSSCMTTNASENFAVYLSLSFSKVSKVVWHIETICI